MARVYGYMDDETGVFTPVGGGQSGNAYGGNGYAPRRVGYGVESMYNPGASYSFPRNNVNAQYGPWYGRQSYATRAPYAPNQPYYERVTGSNGRPVTMRFGEYQREQPVAYETMFNSQGVPVRVPVYASGAPQQTQQAQQSMNTARRVNRQINLPQGVRYDAQRGVHTNLPANVQGGQGQSVTDVDPVTNVNSYVAQSLQGLQPAQSQGNQNVSVSSFLKPVEEPNGVLDLVPSWDSGAPILRQIGVVTGLIPPETPYEQRLREGSVMFKEQGQEWAKRLARWLSGGDTENAPFEGVE